METGSTNVVTAIYLNYRYYDTLFEALMLLFSIIGVIFMSVHEGGEHDE
jgi:multicomponent Na+:H+ antiporter subunit B